MSSMIPKRLMSHRAFWPVLITLSLLVTAVFAWRILRGTKTSTPPHFADLATAHNCAASDLAPNEAKKLEAEFVSRGMKDTTIKHDLLPRVIANLPPAVRQNLASQNIKISTYDRTDKMVSDPSTSRPEADPNGMPKASLKVAGSGERVLLLSPDLDRSANVGVDPSDPEGSIRRGIHETLLPAAIWYVFEVVWGGDPGPVILPESQSSARSVWIGVKSDFAALVRTTAEENEYYQRSLDSGGRDSSVFLARAMTLFTANVYCSRETYDRVTKANPEASDYFHKFLLCALGRPRHMKEDAFNSYCGK